MGKLTISLQLFFRLSQQVGFQRIRLEEVIKLKLFFIFLSLASKNNVQVRIRITGGGAAHTAVVHRADRVNKI